MESIHKVKLLLHLTLERGTIMEVSLKVGEMAPDFSLPATTKEKISLTDYRRQKNVVIAFYGMDFTPG